jgi:transposase-like protein
MAGKPNPPKVYAKEPTGRPLKFTPERRASIIDDISKFVPYELAAEANGITVATLYDWLKTGREHANEGITSDYTIFSDGLKRAEASKVILHTGKISNNVDKWQADAWLLERRWHKHFSANAGINELNQKLDTLIDGDKREKFREEKNDEEGC